MRRLTYKLHGCALSTETKACVPLISMALPMAVIAFHGKDKRFTEPCLRFARTLQLDFFPLLVQPATGERYASPLPSYQHFSAMGTPLRPEGAVKHKMTCRPQESQEGNPEVTKYGIIRA